MSALIDGLKERTRAFVPRCRTVATTAAPSASSPSAAAIRARSRLAAVEQVRRLVAEGYSEVVLTGVDLTIMGG
jgi:hypothetical protein